MTHGVRANVFRNAGKQGIVCDKPLDASGGQAVKIAASVDRFASTVSYEEWFCGVGALVQILLEPLCRLRADEYRAVLLTFAAYHKFASFEIYVVAVEPHKFRYTKPRAK